MFAALSAERKPAAMRQRRGTWPQSQVVDFVADSLDERPPERPHVLRGK